MAAHPRLYHSLYFRVIAGIVAGVALGCFYPSMGEAMKPLGDGFIKLIRMMIAPVIFLTVVTGLARIGDMRKLGRVPPSLLAISPKGSIHFIPDNLKDVRAKDNFANTARMICLAYGVTADVMVLETCLRVPRGTPTADQLVGSKTRTIQSPRIYRGGRRVDEGPLPCST